MFDALQDSSVRLALQGIKRIDIDMFFRTFRYVFLELSDRQEAMAIFDGMESSGSGSRTPIRASTTFTT